MVAYAGNLACGSVEGLCNERASLYIRIYFRL